MAPCHGGIDLVHRLRYVSPFEYVRRTLLISTSVIVITFLPDSPTKARWASEDDKTKYVERVRVNDQGIKQKQWKSDQAIEAFKDPMTYLLFLLPAFSTLVVGGLGTFNNLLINRAFGFTVAESQLLSIPLAAVTVALFYLMA
jgi:hypothetical protein